MGVRVSEVKPSNFFRLRPTSVISKHSTIPVPDTPLSILHTPSFFILGGELLALGKIPGSGGCVPSGVQGQSPWSGGMGRSPQKLKAFCFKVADFCADLDVICK